MTESGAVRAPLSPTKPAGVYSGTDSPVAGSSAPGRFPGHDLNAPYQPSNQAAAPSSGVSWVVVDVEFQCKLSLVTKYTKLVNVRFR